MQEPTLSAEEKQKFITWLSYQQTIESQRAEEARQKSPSQTNTFTHLLLSEFYGALINFIRDSHPLPSREVKDVHYVRATPEGAD